MKRDAQTKTRQEILKARATDGEKEPQTEAMRETDTERRALS